MQIHIFVEPVEQNGYRARSGEPFGVTTDGTTPEEAVQKLREVIAARMAAGGRIVSVHLSESENPWARVAGMFKDDPLFDQWQQAILDRRRELDADPEIP